MPVRPAPAGRAVIGHIPAYLSDRVAFFASCADDSGAVVRCRLVGDGYLLNESEDIRHVLVRNQANYVKSRRLTGPRAEYPKPHSLLTSSGVEHRRRRRAMGAVFRRRLVDGLAATARANAHALAESWVDGGHVDVSGEMTALAQRNILETLLGPATERQLEQLAGASRARRRAFEQLYVSLAPAPEYFPSRANREHLRETRRLRAMVEGEIGARRRADDGRGDLLSMLMRTTYEDGTAMSDKEVREEVLMISLTGYDSVSEALAWTLYLLARNPEVDAALAAEAHAAKGDGSPHARLEYTTRVVRESLRLYPPTWMVVRVALAADTLPSGATIPARALVYLCPYVVHRNPRYWPEPERFDPDRFADDAGSARTRYAYFPFGGGPHVCIGEMLALAQVVTVLAAVTSRHRLTLAHGHEAVPVGGLTLRPKGGLRMRVEPRAS